VNHLAEAATLFYGEHAPAANLLAEHVTDAVKPALSAFRAKLAAAAQWDKAAISAAMKATLAETRLKMPQLAMPLRILVTGRAQTPSIDAVLELLGRDKVLARLGKELS
jgi:glutamyl-tRNA synthetase